MKASLRFYSISGFHKTLLLPVNFVKVSGEFCLGEDFKDNGMLCWYQFLPSTIPAVLSRPASGIQQQDRGG